MKPYNIYIKNIKEILYIQNYFKKAEAIDVEVYFMLIFLDKTCKIFPIYKTLQLTHIQL